MRRLVICIASLSLCLIMLGVQTTLVRAVAGGDPDEDELSNNGEGLSGSGR